MNVDLLAARLCPLYPRPEEFFGDGITMYEFNRPSFNFYLGVISYLKDEGLSDKMIIEILQSKAIRWGLDSFDHNIVNLGAQFAKDHLVD